MKKNPIFFSINNPTLQHSLIVLFFYTIIYLIFFFPVFFSNNLLAPGDGITQSVPSFYSSRTLWTPLLLSGFPVAADVTPQTWYPISLLFAIFPDSWNAFVVSAYVLASCFSYGYIYTITQSKLAALVGGIIYGMSGFMMAHLGHTSMIHTAAWMPLLIWALEKLRYKLSSFWLVIGVFAVACCFLAGHPQIFVYAVGLGGVYALVFGGLAPIGRWKYYKVCLAVLVLGVALSAIQLLPTAELTNLTVRAKLSLADFVTFSLPLDQVIHFIFPYLFGTYPLFFYNTPYFGEWHPGEITGYIGLLPLMLGAIGFLTYGNKSVSRFWLACCLFAFLLTLGKATPLAQVMYHLPAYNKFRVPARHFVEMSLAVSVLAGLGVASLQQKLVSNRLLRKTVLASTGVMLVSTLAIFLFSGQLQAKAIKAGIGQLTLLPWLNPAVGVPLVIFALAVATLIYWSQLTHSKLRGLGLLLILLLDLGSFGWFFAWQNFPPSKDLLQPTVSTQHYRDVLNASQQRMLPIQGGLGAVEAIPPHLSRLWGVPSASGYGPMLLSRLSKLLSMTAAGVVDGNWAHQDNRSLDIMSIRYVFMPKPTAVPDERGVIWSQEDMSQSLGDGCGIEQPNSVNFQVPAGTNANAIGIVSSLTCSGGVPNNAEVLRILVTDAKGKVVTQSLQAGRDTSEWSYECTDVRPYMQHSKAFVFETFPIKRPSFPTCQGHKYVSILPLEKLSDIKSVKLEWVSSSGAIGVQKISLIDRDTQQFYPVNQIDGTARWKHVEDIDATRVYENLRAMPHAWLVPEVVSTTSQEILQAIQSSKLPDGRVFNPSQTALVSNSFKFKAENVDAAATAKVANLSDTLLEVKTSSQTSAFLVLSDIYYPGWRATIDGKSTRLFQTDYVLRGLLVPSGEHIIKFEFKPMSFHLGVGISAASLVVLGYLSIKLRQNRNSLVEN